MAKRTPRIGVALGAGSARGWAHIGALQALSEAGIRPDIVCGTSIGSLVGAVHSDDRLTVLEGWVTALTWRKVLSYFDFTLRGGLLKGGKLFDDLRSEFLGKRIEELKRPFAADATDLATGREIWLREGPVADAVRASIAMPGSFTPYLLVARSHDRVEEGRDARGTEHEQDSQQQEHDHDRCQPPHLVLGHEGDELGDESTFFLSRGLQELVLLRIFVHLFAHGRLSIA